MVRGIPRAVLVGGLFVALSLTSGLVVGTTGDNEPLVERQTGLIICDTAVGTPVEPECDATVPVRPAGIPHRRMMWDVPLEGIEEMYFELTWQPTAPETAEALDLSVCRPTTGPITSCVSARTSRGPSPNYMWIRGSTLDWLLEGANETGEPIETYVWLRYNEHYVVQPYEITAAVYYQA